MERDFIKYFKEDLIAAFGLALVVLPLTLGIAMASGAPPMAGVITVVVGGVVATFLRGSHVTINGPAAGLIVVVLAGIDTLGQGDNLFGFRAVLGATVIAGILQMLLGVAKMGRIGDMFPAAVGHGMLGAVGLIIIGSQAHVALGVESAATSAFDQLLDIPNSLKTQNVVIASVAVVSFGVLFLHWRVKNKFVQQIPSPIWILLVAIPYAYILGFSTPHEVTILGTVHEVGPDYLVHLPDNIIDSFIFPDFSKVGDFSFWIVVITITIISSVESVVSAKSVDKLDSLQRQTNLNRELFAVGASTVVSGALGGLPIITAIPVYNGAKTKFSNLYYGLILLAFVAFLPFIVRSIPLASLAVLLLYTGYQFAAPKIFVDTYRKGDDQFLILLTTLVATLVQGMLFGIISGILITLFIHYIKSNLKREQFFEYLRRPVIRTKTSEDSKEHYIEIEGVINFVNIPKLRETMQRSADQEHIILDMSHTRLVDYSVMEYLHDYAERYDVPNVRLDITGLGAHETSSRHPNAMRVLPDDKKPQLTKRQTELEELAQQYEGQFWPEIRWEVGEYKNFQFFRTRNIEYKFNTAKGLYVMFLDWETCDITLGESAGVFGQKQLHTSVELIHLPFNAPIFVLEREDLVDKIGVKLAIKDEDINFKEDIEFSNKFLLTGPDEAAIRDFFTPDLMAYLKEHSNYYIESNGTMLLILQQMRFASYANMVQMHQFSQGLAKILVKILQRQALDFKDLLL